MGAEMSSGSRPRRYEGGFRSRADRGAKPRSTIRDIGGSGHRSDYKYRGGEEPKTYDDIKAACLESGSLWEDPDFEAADSSIYFKDPPSVWPDIEWLRPNEICDDPQLFIGGASRLDVNQGILGDCWLLAAVSCLATNDKLLHRVIPDDQNFDEGNYAGIFRFVMWQYGRWVEILIDDRLPTHNGKLIYMHSDERNEFWSALIEKAYAKLNNSYENLSGGLTSEALTDFTGGVVERFELRENTPENLFKRLVKAFNKGALMGCSIDACPDEMEGQLDNGLVIGHAYSITQVCYVDVDTELVSGTIGMLRIRNPWGDSHEWKGAWGDGSDEWNMIDEDQRAELGLTFDHDGEFWMSFDDFSKEYQRLEVCHLGPDTMNDDGEINAWEGTVTDAGWRRHVSAGGCRNYPDSFWTNPQFKLTIEEPDDDDEDGLGSIIVGLMQKERRKARSEGKDNLTIGYAIYELEDPDCGTLGRRYFATRASIAKSHAFTNLREVSDNHQLPPGNYVIIPSTFEPNCEGDFVLRIFSEKKDEVKELDDQTGTSDPACDELGEDDDEDAGKAEEVSQAFLSLAGEDGEIDAYELKDIVNAIFQQEFTFDGFTIDVCRGMVAMFDEDMSGKLGYQDFKNLWSNLSMCKKAFKMFDADGSGFFNSYELREAIRVLAVSLDSLKGLRVSNATFNGIVMRYCDKEGRIDFDDFVACVIRLKTMFETFKENDEAGEGRATFTMDEFIQMTMYS